MSTDEQTAPKRRSSAANRRRQRRQGGNRAQQVQQVQEQPQAAAQPIEETRVAVETADPGRSRRFTRRRSEDVTAEPMTASETKAEQVEMDKAARRRAERRRAKEASAKQERRGVQKVVNTERLGPIQKFYHDVMSEIRKVVWPDREATFNLTVVVIAMSAVLGVLLGGLDYILFQIFELIR